MFISSIYFELNSRNNDDLCFFVKALNLTNSCRLFVFSTEGWGGGGGGDSNDSPVSLKRCSLIPVFPAVDLLLALAVISCVAQTAQWKHAAVASILIILSLMRRRGERRSFNRMIFPSLCFFYSCGKWTAFTENGKVLLVKTCFICCQCVHQFIP